MEQLHDALSKFMNGYGEASKKEDPEFGAFVRKEIARIIGLTNIFEQNQYKIDGSYGRPKWPKVPYVAIMNTSETTQVSKGIYIAYLLSADQSKIVLAIMQGSGAYDGKNDADKSEDVLHTAQHFQQIVESKTFAKGPVDLCNLPANKRNYELGTIYYKEYVKEIPHDKQLIEDLREAKAIYLDVLKKKTQGSFNTKSEITKVKSDLNIIAQSIRSKGFSFDNHVIYNYYLCLKTKPFVILAGISGTGKSKLVKLFASAVCKDVEHQYLLVPVRPDWSDSSDLLGYRNIKGEYQAGAIVDFIIRAKEDPENPYFLCLDEMNLARVEYYFSEFLSIMETRERCGNSIVTDPLIPDSYFGADKDARSKYGKLGIPDNLYIIGTVNMDETTFPFSKKVLDRANTIEFSSVDLLPKFNDAADTETLVLDNGVFKSEYLNMNETADEKEKVQKYVQVLSEINDALKPCNLQIGYRIRDEFTFYLLYNHQEQLLEEPKAIDYAIMQKILPRIHGSGSLVKEALCRLFTICAGTYEDTTQEYSDAGLRMAKHLDDNSLKYPMSATKIASMTRRLDEDGFTSFWV